MISFRPVHRWTALLAGGLLAGGVLSAVTVPADAATTTFSYTGPAVPIPDAGDLSGGDPGAPATAAVNVSGVSTSLNKLTFRFDGVSCSTNVGSTTVGLDHSYVSDLQVKLTSPAGTTVMLADRVDGSGHNFCQTVFDDDASTSIQSVATAQAPFTGTWKPASPLSAFNGENPNGIWTVSVQDFYAMDTGNIRAFSLIVDAGNPAVTGLAPTVSGLPQAGQTLTAHAGPVVPADSTLSYVWNADGVPIANQTGSTLQLTNAQAGKQITVTITASHTGYDPETETSAPTDYVREHVAQPKLSLDDNTPARGQTVTVLAQGLQPGSTYTFVDQYIPGGSVDEVADQYGEIHVDVTIPANATVGYDVVGIYGYAPVTAASVTYRVHA